MDAKLHNLSPDAVRHLSLFKREVEAALQGRVAGMTLFGSRARGDAENDSDYDVAVFVRDSADGREVSDLVSHIAYPHVLKGVFISPIVLPADYLHSPRGRTALAEDIDRYGIALP